MKKKKGDPKEDQIEVLKKENEVLKGKLDWVVGLIDKASESETKLDNLQNLGFCDCKESAKYIHIRVISKFDTLTLQTSTVCENCLKEKKYIEEMDKMLKALDRGKGVET